MPRPPPRSLAFLYALASFAPGAGAQVVARDPEVRPLRPAPLPPPPSPPPAPPPAPVVQIASTYPLQTPFHGLRAPAACTSRVIGGHNYFSCAVVIGSVGAARDYCHGFGAELATLASRYENDAVAEFIRSAGGGRRLIGHHDLTAEGRFETFDGSPMSFSSWASGEPNDAGGNEDCVELDASSLWNDVPCAGAALPGVLCEEASPCTAEFFGDHLYHVCRTPPGLPPEAWCRRLGARVATADDPTEGRFLAEHALSVGLDACGAAPSPRAGAVVCEQESPCVRRFFEGRMYQFCLRPGTTATAARRACVDKGGALAVINDARENEFVYSTFATFRRAHFYIDARDDDAEGSFYTRSGPLTFAAWSPGEPNNQGDEDCVELADQGWNDVPCAGDFKNAFICEFPGGNER